MVQISVFTNWWTSNPFEDLKTPRAGNMSVNRPVPRFSHHPDDYLSISPLRNAKVVRTAFRDTSTFDGYV
jgi:hypothetical protein